MTTQVNEYVLTEEELNLRKAMAFLKGCCVGYAISNGAKYKSKKEQGEDFTLGLELAKPISKTYKQLSGGEYTYHVYKDKLWATVCHIAHNRLRHERPHTGSYDSDQFFLTNFEEDRYGNAKNVEEITNKLLRYNLSIPGLA